MRGISDLDSLNDPSVCMRKGIPDENGKVLRVRGARQSLDGNQNIDERTRLKTSIQSWQESEFTGRLLYCSIGYPYRSMLMKWKGATYPTVICGELLLVFIWKSKYR